MCWNPPPWGMLGRQNFFKTPLNLCSDFQLLTWDRSLFQIWRATKTKPVLSAGSFSPSAAPLLPQQNPLFSLSTPPHFPPSLKDSLLFALATAPGLGVALVVGEADVHVAVVVALGLSRLREVVRLSGVPLGP